MVNRFTITDGTPQDGSIDVVISHVRVGGGEPATKTYSPSVEDHQKIIALRDKIVREMATDLVESERLPEDKLGAPIYAALLEINEIRLLPRSDREIGLLKRALIQGNLDNPAHLAKAMVNALNPRGGFAQKIEAEGRKAAGIKPVDATEDWKSAPAAPIKTFGDEDWVTSTAKPIRTFGDEDWAPVIKR